MTDLARSWSSFYGVRPWGVPALVVDVLETHNEWMTLAQISDVVNRIRPVSRDTVERAVHRLRSAGVIEVCWRDRAYWRSIPQVARTRHYRIPDRFYG